MSRRDRVSDFTRPSNNDRSSTRRVVTRDLLPRIAQPKTTTPSTRKLIREVTRPNPVQQKQDKSKVLRRQGLKKLPEFKPKRQKSESYIRRHAVLIGVLSGIILLPVAIFLILSNTGTVKSVQSKIFSNDMPRYLTSSSIMDVATKVTPVDSLDNYEREVTDLNYVGWYKISSKPGMPGVVVIVGDVSRTNQVSPFHNIQEMKKDDYIQVETGDGQILVYKVTEIKKYRPDDLKDDMVLKPAVQGKQGLNLVTYTDSGNSSSELGQYRFVVYAVQE